MYSTEVRLVDQPGIRPGALVRSLAGRDQGTCYLVVRLLDEKRVIITDGQRRPLDRPKAKNRRHLEVLGWCESDLAQRLERGDKVTDLDIDRAITKSPVRVLEEV